MNKKNILLMLLLASISICAWSQTTSKTATHTFDIGRAIVRSYNDSNIFVFNRYTDIFCSASPTSPLLTRTEIYVTDTSLKKIIKICDLPCGYRVYDAQFVTLHRNNTANTPVNFCVFCGTLYESTTDSSGFVGLFYIDTIFQQGTPGSVYLRNVEGCRSLSRFVAYTETNGYYQNTCGNIFNENAVLDMVGLPLNSIARPSTVARVKFYPECNGDIRWDNNIRTPPSGSTERVVDIVKEDLSIVMASVFAGDNHTIWLRRNSQEYYFYFGGMQFSDIPYIIDAYNISKGGTYPNNTYLSNFSLPIRLSSMGSNSTVLSFHASNTGTNGFDGIFSYRFNILNSTIMEGVYIDTIPALKDVCSLYDNLSTALLTQGPTYGSRIYTIMWGTGATYYSFFPMEFSETLQSICRYNSGFINFPYGIVMAYPSLLFSPAMALGYHSYYTVPISPNCMYITSDTGLTASNLVSHLKGQPFGIHTRYKHDPEHYPITAISMVNTEISTNTVCRH